LVKSSKNRSKRLSRARICLFVMAPKYATALPMGQLHLTWYYYQVFEKPTNPRFNLFV
jgi:hypothetical protein